MSEKNITILTVGVVTLLGAIIIGEMYISHTRGDEISSEVVTLLKMAITGILGIIAGHESGKNVAIKLQQEDKKKKEEVSDGS